MNANLIPFAVTYQPRPFTLTSEQERDLLAYARSKGMTSHYVIRHLEPGVRNLITLRRTVLTYEQARARIDQLYEERTMPVRNIQISSNDMRGSTALSLLESAYPDEFASCETIHDVCKALEAHGYTYDPALNLWQQTEAGEEIAPDSALAAMDAQDAQIDLYDALPSAQQAFLTSLHTGVPVVKNAATRLALRRYGYITEADEWDAIELTEIGRAVVTAGMDAVQDDPADVPDDPAPVQDDPSPAPDDPKPFAVGSRVVYAGEFLRLPNGQFGIMLNTEGVITSLIDTGGTVDGAMVRFAKRDGDVSVPLTDLKHHDPFINRQGEMNILRGDDKRATLHAGDYVSVGNKKGRICHVRAGQGDNVMVMMDNESAPRWVDRPSIVVLESVATPFERKLMANQTEIFRLRQLLEKRDAESKKASVAPVNEMDMLRAENARLRAELEAAKAPVQDEPEIPAGDLFSELRTLEGIREQERARVRLAEPTKQEFKILTRATVGQLENLINDGWEKFDSAFTSDADGVIDYSIVLARDIAQPASNGTHKAVADEQVSYIMPEAAPANGHIEAAELSFSDALRLRREGTLTTADVMQVGDLEAQQSARQAAEDLRAAQAERPMRHISQVMVLPTIIAEVKS